MQEKPRFSMNQYISFPLLPFLAVTGLLLSASLGAQPPQSEPSLPNISPTPTGILEPEPALILPRLSRDKLPVRAPSERIEGEPGTMQIVDRSCTPNQAVNLRRRIVNTAVQEWAYFGFNVDDLTISPVQPALSQNGRRFIRTVIPANEAERLASSIAGYWAAAPQSSWILETQNKAWRSADGISARWRNPWSAAFISWVMCESGLAEPAQFERAIAHHSYIDQAIVARDTNDSAAAFKAYDSGEAELAPGDMLCRGSRPQYRTIQQRREQLGQGARTHCDIVVKIDTVNNEILTIGGNVRSSVRMKRLPAAINSAGFFHPLPYSNGRTMFAHLKLSEPVIEFDALNQTPSLQTLSCEYTDSLQALEQNALQANVNVLSNAISSC